MRARMMVALILLTSAVGPAVAQDSSQQRGGVHTETMSRLASKGEGMDIVWNSIGLLGLLGLLGLRKRHSEDGYHPAPLE